MKIFRVGMVIVAFAVLASAGCEKGQMAGQEIAPDEAVKASEGTATAAAPEGVTAATVVIGDKNWTVEVAQSEQERVNGLSGREGLPQDGGMWFIFPESTSSEFWMDGMNFDLDIVFIGEDMKVLNVARGDKTKPKALIKPAGPYLYVLEVAAGGADGVQAGDVVEYRMGPQ